MAIDSNNFLFYADYFVYIAESGLERAKSLNSGIGVISSVNIHTMKNKGNSDIAKKQMIQMLDTSYEYLWLDGQNIDPIRDAFVALSKYVLEETGLTVNQYLTSEGIKVKPLYATLSNIFDKTISSSNIE